MCGRACAHPGRSLPAGLLDRRRVLRCQDVQGHRRRRSRAAIDAVVRSCGPNRRRRTGSAQRDVRLSGGRHEALIVVVRLGKEVFRRADAAVAARRLGLRGGLACRRAVQVEELTMLGAPGVRHEQHVRVAEDRTKQAQHRQRNRRGLAASCACGPQAAVIDTDPADLSSPPVNSEATRMPRRPVYRPAPCRSCPSPCRKWSAWPRTCSRWSGGCCSGSGQGSGGAGFPSLPRLLFR